MKGIILILEKNFDFTEQKKIHRLNCEKKETEKTLSDYTSVVKFHRLNCEKENGTIYLIIK